MGLRHSTAVAASLIFVGVGAAQANWLDDAWTDEWVRLHGSPAITISREAIHVVLPTATLRRAHEEGATTEDVLRQFLDRYGQRCSHVVDLDAPHANLRVELSLQVPGSLEDVARSNEVLTTLRRAYLRQRPDDELPLLFTVVPEHLVFSIDYVPTHGVRCVSPPTDEPTS
jgi:hypothetical protein